MKEAADRSEGELVAIWLLLVKCWLEVKMRWWDGDRRGEEGAVREFYGKRRRNVRSQLEIASLAFKCNLWLWWPDCYKRAWLEIMWRGGWVETGFDSWAWLWDCEKQVCSTASNKRVWPTPPCRESGKTLESLEQNRLNKLGSKKPAWGESCNKITCYLSNLRSLPHGTSKSFGSTYQGLLSIFVPI